MKETLTNWTTVWPRWKCQIIEVPNQLSTIKLITATPDAKVETYSPIDYGREGRDAKPLWEGKSPYQPKRPEGSEWPPHLALARLDLNDEDAIVQFCSLYGLLGLRDIPKWQKRQPMFGEKKIIKGMSYEYSGWYEWGGGKCEPLAIFREAANEYQQAVSLIVNMSQAAPDKAESLARDFEFTSFPYLKGCTLRPVYQEGKWIMGWNIRSLLDAIYFRVILDLTEGEAGYRRCKRSKCGRIFLATNATDAYCSTRCRKANTAANTAIRLLKQELRSLWKDGVINKEQWQLAREEADILYQDGLKDLSKLRTAVIDYIESVKKEGKGKQ